METLRRAIIDGNQDQALRAAQQLRDDGIANERIVTEGIEAAMADLDNKCTVEAFDLLEVMLSGRAVTGVMRFLYPDGAPSTNAKGTVVLGSPEGDVHDLGKNLVKLVLSASGYEVIDCGKDCPAEQFIEAAASSGAMAIGVSGLITMVIPVVRGLRQRFRDRGLGHVKLIAGGAALKQARPEDLNVDYVAQTAFDALHYLDQLRGEKA